MYRLFHSQIRHHAEEIQPIQWRLHLQAHEMPTAHLGHVTHPPSVASLFQATCNLLRAQELPRGLGPQETERLQTRRDDASGDLLETIFW